ncbi:MAG: biotin--[acetyl-CoA-carboxylase] ligase [Holosporaceae bacterium]
MTGVKPQPLPAGYTLYAFDMTSSTMDEAHKLAQKGAPQGTLVLASRQTKGRGRRGAVWSSEAGNLHLSVVLRPRFFLENMSYLSFIMSVAAGHALLPFVKQQNRILYKWPNDLLFDHAKVGGCLLEIEPGKGPYDKPEWVVAGLGLNLRVSPQNLDVPVTSFLDHGIHITPQAFLSFFCVELTNLLSLVEREGFEVVRRMWLRRAFGMGCFVKIKVSDEAMFEGRVEGISDEGALILKHPKGQRFQVSTGQMMLSTPGLETSREVR